MQTRVREVLSLPNLALIVLAALTIGLSYAALTRTSPTPETLSPATAAPSTSPSPTSEGKVVAVVGDELTAAPDGSFLELLAAQRGWALQSFSVAGTGYLTPADPFGARLEQVVAAAPDVLILQGGGHDSGQGDVAAAATTLIEQVRAALPATRIVLMPPLATGQVGGVRDALEEVAATSRVHFLDPGEADPAGPLAAAAQAALAASLVADFDRLQI